MYTEKDPHTPRASDEIDLREFFHRIGSLFTKLWNATLYAFTVLKKRFVLISFFVLVGILGGYGVYKVTKPYYSSSMTLVLSNIRNEFVEDQLSKLVEMINDDNYVAISQNLDISEGAARKIKGMQFSNLDENRIEKDSILTGSPFRIELDLYDSNLFNSMEPALTNYLENNRYFSKQKRIKQRQVENTISKLKNEIISLDSLKTTVSSPRGPVNGFVYGEPIDPTNLYRESLSMFKEQAKLEADLDQLDNIQVVTGFSPRSKPTNPKLLQYLIYGGAFLFFIGLITALRIERNKKLVN